MKNMQRASVAIMIVAAIMAVLSTVGIAWVIGASDLPWWVKFVLLK